jgi:hypothetical protein
MMTADDFRHIALSLEGAVEQAHMGHPDFRANGRIFATLGYPDGGHGMIKLPPEQQRKALRDRASMFAANGAWGRQGATIVRLELADAGAVRDLLTTAWRQTARRPARRRARTARR